jgi:hypothetical protein
MPQPGEGPGGLSSSTCLAAHEEETATPHEQSGFFCWPQTPDPDPSTHWPVVLDADCPRPDLETPDQPSPGLQHKLSRYLTLDLSSSSGHRPTVTPKAAVPG